MRRFKQGLPIADCENILLSATSGVLALCGDDGFPYAVPLSFAYDKSLGRLIFHCALEGQKLDIIRQNPKASFCVIANDHVIPLEYRTEYQSIIVSGEIHELTDKSDKRAAIEFLAARLSPTDTDAHRDSYIDAAIDRVCALEMRINHISGKRDLLNCR